MSEAPVGTTPAPPKEAAPWLQRSPWSGCWLSVALALAAYALSIGHDFTYDDVPIIRDNALLHSLGNWREVLTSTWWKDALYRPFTALTFAVDWAIAGGRPAWFHSVNVLLHAGATALVFVLARGMLGPVGATAAAALFAVHPVHAEAVANVVGRAEVLAAVGVMSAVLLYRAHGRLVAAGNESWRRGGAAVGALAALLLGLAAKESAFVAPGLLLLVDWRDAQARGERWGDGLRRHLALWVASVALTGAWLGVWLAMQGDLSGGGTDAPGLVGAGMHGRLMVMAPIILHYARLLLFPAALSADYSPDFLPVSESWSLAGAAGIGTVVAAIGLAWWARQRASPVSFGIAWALGALVIVSNVLVPTEILLAERTLYLASVGAVVPVGWVIEAAAARRRAWAVGGLAVLVALGFARTATRVPIWKDNATFFPQLVRDAPGSYRAFWVAGMLAYEDGDHRQGEALIRRAIDVYPLDPSVWEDLARLYEREARWGQAGLVASVAFRLSPHRPYPAVMAMTDYLRAGMVDSATAVAERAEPTVGTRWEVRLASADVALARGEPREAMLLRQQVAQQYPERAEFWAFAAEAAVQAGLCAEARRFVARVRALEADTSVRMLENRLEEACDGARP